MDELKAILRSLNRIQEDPSSSGASKDEVAERLETFLKSTAYVVPMCQKCGSDLIEIKCASWRQWQATCGNCRELKRFEGTTPAEAIAAFGRSLDGKSEDG